jgi:nicotinamidase-related amidase
MGIDPKTTAVVLIEYQNDFTSEGGVLHGAVSEVMDKTGGYENGYRVITLTDCLAATSAEEHDNALKDDFPMFSQPMSSADFITELDG